jgi:hypothetical protein
MIETQTDAAREARLRRLAKQQGYSLRKDRARSWNSDHFGGYMIVNDSINAIVAGSRFDLDLDEVETFLAD